MELNLNDTIKNLQINHKDFICDTTDLASIRALIKFDEKYQNIRSLNKTFLLDCKNTINIVLGKGSYETLFDSDSLKPYYLIQKLKEIFYSDVEKYAKNNTKKEVAEIQDVLLTINNMTDTLEKMNNYAEKYGIN